MRRFAILLLLVAILSGSAGPVLAEPAFGNNCLSCHSQLQTDKLVIFGQDTMADPNESATGAPDRGVLPVFQALRGQVKAFHAQVENLSANDTYAVQLTRLRYPGVENGGTLVYEGDCDWPEWGESAVYYSEPVVAYHWSEGPASFAFDISVAPGAGADYYDLLFAVAGCLTATEARSTPLSIFSLRLEGSASRRARLCHRSLLTARTAPATSPQPAASPSHLGVIASSR